MKIKVFGQREVFRHLGKVSNEIRQKIKHELITTALTDIETPAKQQVPVDTGRLRSSIHTVQFLDKSNLTVEVVASVRYARKIHRTGGKGGKGQGYLIKNLEKAKPGLKARLQKIVKG